MQFPYQYNIKIFDITTFCCIISLIFYALGILNESLQTISLNFLIPLSALLIFIKTGKLIPNIYLKLYICLLVWSLLSLLFAYNQDASWLQIKRMVGVYAFCYILTYMAKNRKTMFFVMSSYYIFFFACIIYAQTHIIGIMGEDLGITERLNDDKLNANVFGYYLFIITFLTYLLGIIVHNLNIKFFFKLFFLLLIPLSFYLAFLTASRQILILQIPYFIILLYKRYWGKLNFNGRIISLIIFLVLGVLTFNKIISFYTNSLLSHRSEISYSEDERSTLLIEALNVGINNFFWGVGPDNFIFFNSKHSFSHNSYLELFANTGIIALIIYLFILYKFLSLEYKQFRNTRSEINYCFLWFGIFYAFDNIFYVFYTGPWLMGIFMFAASLAQNYQRNLLKL